MHRSHLVPIAVVSAVLGSAAPASAVVVAPAETRAGEVSVKAGPDGRAVLAWAAGGRRVEVSEFAPATGFGPATKVLEAPTAGDAFGALTPDRLVVLATRGQAAGLPTEAVAVERQTSGAFSAPATIAAGEQFAQVVGVDANARGDVAATIRVSSQRVVLVTAPRGGRFGAPQEIGRPGDRFYTAAVAVGPDGRLVVAYYDGRSLAYAQRGSVGGPLGAPQVLSRTRYYPDFRAAIDGAGTATVAYVRNIGRRAAAVVAARARAGHSFGPTRILARSSNVLLSSLAAAGTTTAVSWDDVTSSGGVRVAIARGSGRFGRPQSPVARPFKLRGEAGRYPSQANSVRLAVDARGDVLAAYPYGPFGSVHVATLRAGRRSFGSPYVVSSLGNGGYPQAALTTRRRPIVAWRTSDGAVHATGSARGDAVSFHPPRPTLTRIDTGELGSHGVVTTKLRCSSSCAYFVIARITTGRARGQVITRRHLGQRVLRAGSAETLRFELKAGGAQAFQRTGRAQIKVIVTAANASGASHTVRRVVELGRRFNG